MELLFAQGGPMRVDNAIAHGHFTQPALCTQDTHADILCHMLQL